MPEIQPFAALRYNPETVDLEKVVVPPYDVIKEADRQKMAEEPHSGVRLTLTTEEPGDTETSNKYTRSRDLFRAWQEDGALVKDEEPSLYVLAQDFTWDGRRHTRMHLVASVRLHEWAEGVILPHEKILQGPKDDRQRLIETTRANYEPVFGLTMGSGRAFRGLLEAHSQGDPLLSVTLPNGERNRVWRVSDPEAITEFQRVLADTQVVIADGHHRYTASLGVKRDMNAREGAGPWDYLMMTLAAMDDPDLLVLPTHRIVSGMEDFSFDLLVEKLDAAFVIEEQDSLENLLRAMDEKPGVAMGLLAWPDSAFLLTPWESDRVADLIPGEQSEAWKSLDVSVLHGLVMDRMLGLGAGESPRIRYTRDASEAHHAIESGEAQLAFLLKPTPPDAVRVIALNGETMPQKSTFFYPKLLTGLLMREW